MNSDAQTCPSPDLLAQVVSGNLPEVEAETVFEHVERCVDCQQRLDRLAHRADSLLQVARQAINRPSPPPSEADGNLSDLIRRAQRVGSADDTQVDAQGKTAIVSRDRFIKAIRQCGLLEQEEVERWIAEVESDALRSKDDSSALAQSLVRERKLTPFQARLLVRGRWRGLVLGKYEIIDQLAAGGMGKLFIGRHRQMDRVVCIKMVQAHGEQTDQMMDRFQNEVRVLGSLSHPNIVAAHDADHASVGPYLVMEYVEGQDLAKRVRSQGPLTARESLKVVLDVAWAMDYAHGQGVVHRDIKPHNLLLHKGTDSDPVVKILDLGLARFDTMLSDNPDASLIAAMTSTGVVVGTVDYMSPEQALDSRTADARSDIYSLGCTLYFLLTGRPPFSGETVMQRLVAHREQTHTPLADSRPDITPNELASLESLITRMLAKQPEQRYQTMGDLARDVERVMRGESIAPMLPSAHLPAINRGHEGNSMAGPAVSNPSGVVASTIATPIDSSATLPPDPVVLVAASFPLAAPPTALRSDAQLDVPVEATELASGNSELQQPRIHQPRSLRWSRAASLLTVFGVLLVATLIAWATSGRTGAALAIKNGGPGRALVVVSSLDFNPKEYATLLDALARRKVAAVTASPQFGADGDFGVDIKAGADNIPLHDVIPQDYDAVFFISGEKRGNWDLIHKSKTNHEKVKQIVSGAMEHDVLFGVTGGGYKVLSDATSAPICLVGMGNGLEWCPLGDTGAKVVKAKELKLIAPMVDKLLALASAQD